ncbi:pyroglutamyl-peptidase I [Ruminococcaceae bacterium OttesenSCG-928-L11]|nr:pyroglutamyl-peptidase I [Ruminococcaceae bacterium OttesenSCG-928-L11]
MKLLLTAFEPFGGDARNPAWEAVQLVQAPSPAIEITKLQVPTVFHDSIRTVVDAVAADALDAVLSVGLAGGRSSVAVERVAINVDDARIPDNRGNRPIDEPICADGPPACFSTLPIKAMVAEIRRCGLPAEISNSAGTYVCNHLMYGVLHHAAAQFSGVRAGFIHVPYTPDLVLDKPSHPASMALPDIVRALEAAICAIAAHQTDCKSAEGSLY